MNPQVPLMVFNGAVVLLSIIITYLLTYRTGFVRWFFRELIVPRFENINKRYVRFQLYSDLKESMGLERYRRSFFFILFPVVLIFLKILATMILPTYNGIPTNTWGANDGLLFLILLMPVGILLSRANIRWFRHGLILGTIGAGVLYVLRRLPIEALEPIRLLPSTYPLFTFVAGIFLVYSAKLITNYPGNYHFIMNHRIFMRRSSTNIFGEKINPVKKGLNGILNIYLAIIPLLMLVNMNNIYRAFAAYLHARRTDEEAQVVYSAASKGDLISSTVSQILQDVGANMLVNITTTGLAIITFFTIAFAVLPLSRGMFQYRIFSILGHLQDALEQTKSEDEVLLQFDRYKKEFKDVGSIGDLLIFVLMFDAILSLLVNLVSTSITAGDVTIPLIGLTFIPVNNLILLLMMIKVQIYGAIIIGLILSRTVFKEEKRDLDFFKNVQTSFFGRDLDLRYFRLGKIEEFDPKPYMQRTDDVEIWIERAQQLRKMYRHSVARKCIKKGVKLMPDDPRVRTLQAVLLSSEGLHWSAERRFRDTIDRYPEYGPVFYEYGKHLFFVGKREEALEMFKEASRNLPDSHKPLDYAGWAYLMMERYDEARRVLNVASSMAETKFRPWINLAKARNELNDQEGAMAALRKALFNNIEDLTSWAVLGDVNAHLGNRRKAIFCFEVAEEVEISSFIYLKRGQAFRYVGSRNIAKEWFAKAFFNFQKVMDRTEEVAEDKGLFGLFNEDLDIISRDIVGLAHFDTWLMEVDEIRDPYFLREEAERERGYSLVGLSILWRERGDVDKSLSYAEQAVELYHRRIEGLKDSRDAVLGFEDKALRSLGRTLLHKDEYHAASEAFATAFRFSGQVLDLYLAAEALVRLGRAQPFPIQQISSFEDAITLLDEALEIYRKKKRRSAQDRFMFVEAGVMKGQVLEILGGYDKALEHFIEMRKEKEVEHFKQYWKALGDLFRNYQHEEYGVDEDGAYFLAAVTDTAKYYQEAEECYEKALEIAPSDTDTLLGLGILYALDNNEERTYETVEKLLAMSANVPWALKNLRNNLAFRKYMKRSRFQRMVKHYAQIFGPKAREQRDLVRLRRAASRTKRIKNAAIKARAEVEPAPVVEDAGRPEVPVTTTEVTPPTETDIPVATTEVTPPVVSEIHVESPTVEPDTPDSILEADEELLDIPEAEVEMVVDGETREEGDTHHLLGPTQDGEISVESTEVVMEEGEAERPEEPTISVEEVTVETAAPKEDIVPDIFLRDADVAAKEAPITDTFSMATDVDGHVWEKLDIDEAGEMNMLGELRELEDDTLQSPMELAQLKISATVEDEPEEDTAFWEVVTDDIREAGEEKAAHDIADTWGDQRSRYKALHMVAGVGKGVRDRVTRGMESVGEAGKAVRSGLSDIDNARETVKQVADRLDAGVGNILNKMGAVGKKGLDSITGKRPIPADMDMQFTVDTGIETEEDLEDEDDTKPGVLGSIFGAASGSIGSRFGRTTPGDEIEDVDDFLDEDEEDYEFLCADCNTLLIVGETHRPVVAVCYKCGARYRLDEEHR